VVRHSFKRAPLIRVSPKELRTVDGILFASGGESRRYLELRLLQEQGHIVFFLLQPRFELGGGTKYTSDFLIFWQDGRTTIEDVKGYRTPKYIKAKKQVEARYPITITEIQA